MADEKKRVTTDGQPADGVTPGAPKPLDPETGQHGAYYVLSEEERGKGFVRPLRSSYVHSRCATVTKMGTAIAETYAREPSFYASTFCVSCKDHFDVAEFVWDGTDEVLGS